MSDAPSDAPSERGAPADGLARRHALAAALVIAATLGAVAVRRLTARLAPRPSTEQCAKLVDHYLEHVQRQRTPAARPEELARAVDDARGSADHAGDVTDCTRRLTRAQVECGLTAPNADELERCVQ